jgi:hypothetical protein
MTVSTERVGLGRAEGFEPRDGQERDRNRKFWWIEQQSCSELTGFRVRSERCCEDLERLKRLRDLALPGVLPGQG